MVTVTSFKVVRDLSRKISATTPLARMEAVGLVGEGTVVGVWTVTVTASENVPAGISTTTSPGAGENVMDVLELGGAERETATAGNVTLEAVTVGLVKTASPFLACR